MAKLTKTETTEREIDDETYRVQFWREKVPTKVEETIQEENAKGVLVDKVVTKTVLVDNFACVVTTDVGNTGVDLSETGVDVSALREDVERIVQHVLKTALGFK